MPSHLTPWPAILAETTASSTAHTEKTVTTGPQPTYPQPTENLSGNVTKRQRVAFVIGMRTEEIFGVKHGAHLQTHAQSESQSERNRAEMNYPGRYQLDREIGCWHQKCKHALADPSHVLCMHCKSMAKETPQYLKRFARAIQRIQTALLWQPPA